MRSASPRPGRSGCLGLIRGVWRAAIGPEPEAVPPYTRDWAEPAGEEVLLAAGGRWLWPRGEGATEAGDILVFRMKAGGIAKHLGIAAETGAGASFIHAYSGHAVVESPLSEPWRRRIAARFVFPLD